MFLPQQFRIGFGFLLQRFELVIVGFEFVNLLLQLYDSVLEDVERRRSGGSLFEALLKPLTDAVHDLCDAVQLELTSEMKK